MLKPRIHMRGRYVPLKPKHEHDFVLDQDGQVTCKDCGAMDDDKDYQ
jgi:hypothetical protein